MFIKQGDGEDKILKVYSSLEELEAQKKLKESKDKEKKNKDINKKELNQSN